jgi:hypothetical protein
MAQMQYRNDVWISFGMSSASANLAAASIGLELLKPEKSLSRLFRRSRDGQQANSLEDARQGGPRMGSRANGEQTLLMNEGN